MAAVVVVVVVVVLMKMTVTGGVGERERGRDGGGCASRAVQLHLPVRAKCSVIGLVSRGSVRCGRTRSK